MKTVLWSAEQWPRLAEDSLCSDTVRCASAANATYVLHRMGLVTRTKIKYFYRPPMHMSTPYWSKLFIPFFLSLRDPLLRRCVNCSYSAAYTPLRYAWSALYTFIQLEGKMRYWSKNMSHRLLTLFNLQFSDGLWESRRMTVYNLALIGIMGVLYVYKIIILWLTGNCMSQYSYEVEGILSVVWWWYYGVVVWWWYYGMVVCVEREKGAGCVGSWLCWSWLCWSWLCGRVQVRLCF